MLIYKILNNNAVISRDVTNKEIIVIGKGIAYKKSLYDEIDSTVCEKIFYPKNENQKSRIEGLVSEIPLEYIDFTEKAIELAQSKIKTTLDSNLLIALTDHIYFSVQKNRKGLYVPNLLVDEIQNFYSHEFEIGKEIVTQMNRTFNVMLDEAEAGFIAFHLINAQQTETLDDTIEIVREIKEISEIVKNELNISEQNESIDYSRFKVHLKFFMHRVFSKSKSDSKCLKEDTLFNMLIEKYPQINLCVDKIAKYTYELNKYVVSDSDRMYLIIHLARILDI